jgi:hypothetical protein
MYIPKTLVHDSRLVLKATYLGVFLVGWLMYIYIMVLRCVCVMAVADLAEDGENPTKGTKYKSKTIRIPPCTRALRPYILYSFCRQ